ncbi:MAG: DUF5620 domain-containing protein [Oscillospiraceae bacterium]
MNTNTMSNRMKAIAIAAVTLLSFSAFGISAMTESNDIFASAAAVEINEEMGVKEKITGYTADLAPSGIKTITFTCVADYDGSFSWGFGINTDVDPDYWEEVAEGEVENVVEGEPFTVTIDVSDVSLQYNPSDSKWASHYEFRDYYSGGDGWITVLSAEANVGETTDATDPSTTDPSDPSTTDPSTTDPKTEDPTSPSEPSTPSTTTGEEVKEGDTFVGYWEDYAKSGIKNIAITFVANYTGSFSYGMGIGVEKSPYWYEADSSGKWVDTSDGTEVPGTSVAVEEGQEYTVVFDTSKYALSYNPKTDKYPGHFEFRNYYGGENGDSITITNIEANSTKKSTVVAATTDPEEQDEHKLSKKDGTTSVNPVSGNASFVDNKDGTATFTATQARQIEFDTPYLLTRGFDEEYYANEGISWKEGTDPINSHKFSYNQFGITGVGEGTVIESLTATIQSDVNIKNFMYGGGLNVNKDSKSDTESAKAAKGATADENAGYWYNDMGEEKIEEYETAGVEFGITPSYGYYLTASEEQPLGQYFSVIWDVPEEVKEDERSGEISFQYWYGVEDAEEYTEVETVNLVGGVITYTQTKTFDYTDTASYKVGKEIKAGDMSGELSFADIGVPIEGATSDVKAVVFNLKTTADLDKLVYGVGASVGDEFKMYSDKDGGEEWDYVVMNPSAGNVQITWLVPDGVDINEEYGNVQFGYWYGGKGETTLDSVTLESVDVYYYSEEKEPELTVTTYGDVDCNGVVDIADVLLLNQYLLGIADIENPQGKVNGDVDNNNSLNDTDALNILKSLVDLVTLPVK